MCVVMGACSWPKCLARLESRPHRDRPTKARSQERLKITRAFQRPEIKITQNSRTLGTRSRNPTQEKKIHFKPDRDTSRYRRLNLEPDPIPKIPENSESAPYYHYYPFTPYPLLRPPKRKLWRNLKNNDSTSPYFYPPLFDYVARKALKIREKNTYYERNLISEEIFYFKKKEKTKPKLIIKV